eukprot:13695708-Alexandrium_andersonii.AAC.1
MGRASAHRPLERTPHRDRRGLVHRTGLGCVHGPPPWPGADRGPNPPDGRPRQEPVPDASPGLFRR